MQVQIKWLFLIILALIVLEPVSCFQYNISAPKEIEAGKWFDVNVTVYSDEPENFEVYSYVYKGFESFGQGWTANRQNISLSGGETRSMVLSDLVKHNTEDGLYNIRVRFKFSDTEQITETYNLKVMSGNVFEETYIYASLIAFCVAGFGLALMLNR